MLQEDVRVGMKVVPHDKTAGTKKGLENSVQYKRMLADPKKNYLYVIKRGHGSHYLLHLMSKGETGELFDAADFSMYQPKAEI